MAESSGALGASTSDVARRLIEATIDVIDARGEAAVRLIDVAAAAGASKSSIHYFFGDREGLIAAAEAERYIHLLNDNFDAVDAFLDTGPTREEWSEFVVGIYASHGTDAGRDRRRRRIEILGSSVSRDRLRAAVAEENEVSIQRMAAVIERAQQLGLTARTHSALAISTWAHGLMMGRFQAEILGDPTREQGWDEVTATVVRTIFA